MPLAALLCLVCFVVLFRVTCAHVLYFFWKQLTSKKINVFLKFLSGIADHVNTFFFHFFLFCFLVFLHLEIQ